MRSYSEPDLRDVVDLERALVAATVAAVAGQPHVERELLREERLERVLPGRSRSTTTYVRSASSASVSRRLAVLGRTRVGRRSHASRRRRARTPARVRSIASSR